jgi:hypothetical protein
LSEPAESIAELMAVDPLQLTKEDRTQIIAYYRENREKFITGLKMSKLPKAAKQTSKGPLPDIDLGDLSL